MSLVIYGSDIVVPDGTLSDAWVLVEDGRIAEIGSSSVPRADQTIDGRGYLLMPGLIDLHSDAIEQEICPRPGAMFDVDFALSSLEAKLVAHGTTTIYHSISFNENGKGVRTRDAIVPVIESISALAAQGTIRHLVHARYDICEYEFSDIVYDLIDRKRVQMLSFMDHSPGQGQYASIESFLHFLKRHRGLNDSEAMSIVDQQLARKKDPAIAVNVDKLSAFARQAGIPMASHDDDSPEKVEFMRGKGVSISEFPINIETARKAMNDELCVMVGAPNVLKRKSNSGNLSAIQAIAEGAANALCSDYVPTSMLQAIFDLEKLAGLPLHRAVALATVNPAQAAGLADEIGSIKTGLSADLLLVSKSRKASVDFAMVGGEPVLVRGGLAASFFRQPSPVAF